MPKPRRAADVVVEPFTLPLDDNVKAFIDYLIDRAIEQWIEANASQAPESPSTPDSPASGNERPA